MWFTRNSSLFKPNPIEIYLREKQMKTLREKFQSLEHGIWVTNYWIYGNDDKL